MKQTINKINLQNDFDFRQQLSYSRKLHVASRLRMMRFYNLRISNLIILERYKEAETDARKLAGILGAWEANKNKDIDQCLKSSSKENYGK